jgi:type II secretion system protein G
MKSFLVGLFVALLTACSTQSVQTVGWYIAHDSDRIATVAKCQNNPGELASTPNCINALQAQRDGNAKYNAGKNQVRALEMFVQAYILDNGEAPKELSGLLSKPADAKNWNGPYCKPESLTDPFGNLLIYKAPGDHGDFDIVFLGADGQVGGTGWSKDFGNWE